MTFHINYFRLHENTRFQVRTTDDDNSPSSVSRSSSINSLNNANSKKTDEQTLISHVSFVYCLVVLYMFDMTISLFFS